MTRQSLTRIAAGAAVAGLVALAATPAGALPRPFSPTSSSSVPGSGSGQPGAGTHTAPTQAAPTGTQGLAGIQQAAAAAINARVKTLTTAVADLGKVPPGCDVSALMSTAQADITKLQALEAKIQADTTVQDAKADAQTIFTDFRVYALVVPVDEMVVATCRTTDAANKVNTLVQKLQGVNDPNIAALVTDMGNQAQAALAAVNHLASTLEGYSPSDWNSDHDLLKGARQSLRTARQDLEKARDDGHKILGILHHDLGGGNGASTVHPNTSTSTTSSTTSTTAA
ncbi:MAG TPA: hypothetical protein VFA83_15515 [Acidimicrobiales bacterium]|nr:hypothetical protein [Acidimicrobiales bacterium]